MMGTNNCVGKCLTNKKKNQQSAKMVVRFYLQCLMFVEVGTYVPINKIICRFKLPGELPVY